MWAWPERIISRSRAHPSDSVEITWSQLSFTTERWLLAQQGQAERHADPCCSSSYVSDDPGQVPGHHSTFIPTHLPNLQDVPPLHGFFLPPGSSPSSFWVCFSFQELLHFLFFVITPSSFQEPIFSTVSCVQKYIPWIASKLMDLSHVTLYTGGLKKCHFCLVLPVPGVASKHQSSACEFKS